MYTETKYIIKINENDEECHSHKINFANNLVHKFQETYGNIAAAYLDFSRILFRAYSYPYFCVSYTVFLWPVLRNHTGCEKFYLSIDSTSKMPVCYIDHTTKCVVNVIQGVEI